MMKKEDDLTKNTAGESETKGGRIFKKNTGNPTFGN